MKFDLKGSLLNRETHFSSNEANWWSNGKSGSNKIMKDVNFLQIQKDFNYGLIKFTNE